MYLVTKENLGVSGNGIYESELEKLWCELQFVCFSLPHQADTERSIQELQFLRNFTCPY